MIITITYRMGRRTYVERMTRAQARNYFMGGYTYPRLQVLQVTYQGGRNVAADPDWIDRMDPGACEGIDLDD